MPPGQLKNDKEKNMSQNLRGCIFDYPEPGLLLKVENGTSGAEYEWVQLLPSLTHSFPGVSLYRVNSTVRSDKEALHPLPVNFKGSMFSLLFSVLLKYVYLPLNVHVSSTQIISARTAVNRHVTYRPSLNFFSILAVSMPNHAVFSSFRLALSVSLSTQPSE